MKEKEYGISRRLVERAMFRCSTCNKGRLLPDDELTLLQLDTTDQKITCVNQSKSVASSKQVLTQKDADVKQVEKARFPSMVAHVPDRTCIWYDRKCK